MRINSNLIIFKISNFKVHDPPQNKQNLRQNTPIQVVRTDLGKSKHMRIMDRY